jgi:hypothetical protein
MYNYTVHILLFTILIRMCSFPSERNIYQRVGRTQIRIQKIKSLLPHVNARSWLLPGHKELDHPRLRVDGAAGQSLRRQFLAHSHQRDTVHLAHTQFTTLLHKPAV